MGVGDWPAGKCLRLTRETLALQAVAQLGSSHYVFQHSNGGDRNLLSWVLPFAVLILAVIHRRVQTVL